jgi:hypothetical protein
MAKRAKLSEEIKRYGIRGYNGVRIKDIYMSGDCKNRPIQARIIVGMGDGAERSHYQRTPKLFE